MGSLVSVIIASYNSSSFVIETLESVSKQTWQEIELIITDDCSGDDTVEACQKWLNHNKNRFIDAKILTSEKNTGVSGNVNRGLYSATGDWIKLLGADDTLKPDCIAENMKFITSNSEIKVLFSRIEVYNNTFDSHNLIVTIPGDPFSPKSITAPGRSVGSQYRMLLLSDRIHFSPSVFLNRETLLSLGGFDERFKAFEDYPLWLNLTKNGHKLFFMDKVTVNYRRHAKAVNNTGNPYLINPNYFNHEDFRLTYTYPNLPADIRLSQRFDWFASQIFRFNLTNKNKWPNRFLLNLLTIYLNPFKYYIYLKKRLIKDVRNNEFYTD